MRSAAAGTNRQRPASDSARDALSPDAKSRRDDVVTAARKSRGRHRLFGQISNRLVHSDRVILDERDYSLKILVVKDEEGENHTSFDRRSSCIRA